MFASNIVKKFLFSYQRPVEREDDCPCHQVHTLVHEVGKVANHL